MAEQNSDLIDNCPVCSKAFAELGDTVPKRLPCEHSLCTKCATLKLFNPLDCRLECPECGETHVFTGGIDFIPKNDRIIDKIKRKRLEPESSRVCEKHGEDGRKIGLYCYNCNEFLCVLCLEEEHQTCGFQNIYTFGDEEAIASRWKKDLQIDREELILARKENEEKSEFCMEQIKLEKDRMLMEITKVFDELLKIVSDDKKENDIELEDMLVETEANMTEIDGVLKRTNSRSSATLKHLETVIKTKARPNERATMTSFTHYEYTKSKAGIQRFCGQLKEKTFFTKTYFCDPIDESESEDAGAAIYDSGNKGSTDDDDDDNDDDPILSEDTDYEIRNQRDVSDSDHAVTPYDDVCSSVRSPTKRRLTRQSAFPIKLKETAEEVRIDSSDSTGVVSGASPAKKRRSHLEEKHNDFGIIHKGNYS